MDYTRKPEERDAEYIQRVCAMKDLIGTWQDVADILNAELGTHKTEGAYRKAWHNSSDTATGQNDLREILKEREKLRTEKIEYNRWLRGEARDEMLCDRIVDAIKALPPIERPAFAEPSGDSKRVGVLCFGDEHFGLSFHIPGLCGDAINTYGPEIFFLRMWELLDRTVEICKREGFTSIKVYSLGDSVDGILRVGQLMKLRYGVVEGSIIYANFMAEWLDALTEHVNVDFQMVFGNHTELRMLGQPKGTFTDENMGFVIYELIRIRLAKNARFKISRNDSGLIFDNLVGYNVLGFHGEVKNLEQAIKDFSMAYKVPIDILIGAHVHHQYAECVGRYTDVISIPSIMGVDPYSMSLNRTSVPGATFAVLEEGKGKSIEYTIKLNT